MSDVRANRDEFDGQSSSSTNVLQVSGMLDPTQTDTELWMPDGRVLRLPTSVLIGGKTGLSDLAPLQADTDRASAIVPVVEETLVVEKRIVETGKVRIKKTIQEYQEILDEPLAVHTFDIEHVVLNRSIDAPPAIRQDGETTIYPVVEEQVVLTKQLILKEEIRVTKRNTERRDNQVVTLRREHVVVERSSGGDPSDLV